MIDWSTFQHAWTKSAFLYKAPISEDYKVYCNGQEIPVYTCRISAYPFNRPFPGHQREVEQTEIVSYVNLVADEEVCLEVQPLTKTAAERVMLKPYQKGVQVEKQGGRYAFTLKENGGYVFELDDYHGLLYIFNNKPVAAPNPKDVTYYFGPGVYFTGKITLQSNESVYVDKDALVYGCIYAEDAENIRVFGNGIFDDGAEERIVPRTYEYEPFTNGNAKFYDCKNVRLQGVGFTNSAMWCINLFHCFDVEIDAINVFGQWRYNSDGVDIVNSQRVTVRNSFIHSFDDTITVKGIDRYATTDNADMLFEDCVLWCDWGKTCELGLESMCREFKNITFRNCDIVRGGNTACDIQTGDCAEVHHITFENIRLELEGFYTPPVLQKADGERYNAHDGLEIAATVMFRNPRFRQMGLYANAFSDKEPAALGLCEGDERYAGIHDIVVRDIYVYADEKVLAARGTRCVALQVENKIPTTKFANIVIENVSLNGKRLEKEEMILNFQNVDVNEICVK